MRTEIPTSNEVVMVSRNAEVEAVSIPEFESKIANETAQ